MKFKNVTGGSLYLAAIKQNIKRDGIFEAEKNTPTISNAIARKWIIPYEEPKEPVAEKPAEEKTHKATEDAGTEKAPEPVEDSKEEALPEKGKVSETVKSIPAKAVITPSGQKKKKRKAGGEKE